LSGHGYIDFVIDDVAVEFAVRKPGAARSALSASVNSTEVKKLMKYDGKALLVLFDFSDTPIPKNKLSPSGAGLLWAGATIANPRSMSRISLWKNAAR
jgi:hypothetical protein